MRMNGGSTGHFPIQVRIRNLATMVQNSICEKGRKVLAFMLDVWRIGIRKSTRIEAARAITPPSLLGMDRRIA